MAHHSGLTCSSLSSSPPVLACSGSVVRVLADSAGWLRSGADAAREGGAAQRSGCPSTRAIALPPLRTVDPPLLFKLQSPALGRSSDMPRPFSPLIACLAGCLTAGRAAEWRARCCRSFPLRLSAGCSTRRLVASLIRSTTRRRLHQSIRHATDSLIHAHSDWRSDLIFALI